MGRVSRMVAVLAAVGMLFSGGGMASAAESTGAASGGASQCVPDRSTIAQCFPDKALAQTIAFQLRGDTGRTGEVLTSWDVENTTSLSATGNSGFSGVSSVQGLQVFTNLTDLSLYNTRVSDVSPLSKLTDLKTLDLRDTGVSDVSPLSHLVNLKWLYLDGTGVSDVSPLSNLTKFECLTLNNTRVSDVSPLSNLTKFECLTLNNTRVSDVSPLSKLVNLTRLDLGDTGVSDVSPLSKLVNLTDLDLRDTGVSDVSPLSKLTDLTDLDLGDTGVSDVSPLSKLTDLKKLDLDNTGVSDVSPLSHLVNLKDLELYGTRVSDVSPLSNLTKLEWLDLGGTQVLDVSPLAKLNLSWFDGTNGMSNARNMRPSVKLTVNADGSVSLPAPRWDDGTFVAPSSTSPAGGVLDAKRGVVTWKGYDATASYSYDFDRGGVFTGHVAGVKPASSVVFRDVSSSTPHASDIAWLADAGVSTGWLEPDGSYSFRGMDSVKRQDMAAFLRREASRRGAAGVPAGAGYARFRDVTEQTPHADDIGWLSDAKVSTGWREPDGSRTFRGMDPVRRQDMAAFLRREATLMGVKDAASWKPSDKDWRRFRDVSRDTPHAEDVLWLAHANVSTGYADGTFGGMLPVYRQDMAAFLHRLDGLKK
ncbi:leucine-rich repeat domain-containing protein [Bifidobacterium boum]|uniref:leucine-rich repeat domain-containing protein n=1 Tax=Bifidobacterium boum TaxID=78343 RepID=UPI003F8FF442